MVDLTFAQHIDPQRLCILSRSIQKGDGVGKVEHSLEFAQAR